MQQIIRCNTHLKKLNCPNSEIVGNYRKHKAYIKKLTLASGTLTVGSLSGYGVCDHTPSPRVIRKDKQFPPETKRFTEEKQLKKKK